ncbi:MULTISPECIES: HvfC/BufC N-terminal domain-containing protein [Deefgea]|nr:MULTISPECIES: DNA-binding domain-containing protein [Deefgea]MBM9887792.1 putative DNA-binding domain-containing protein [Deefgea sp. CFH1-16]
MTTYSQLIAQFAAALDQAEQTNPSLSDDSQSNFDIYRNNIQLNRINALRIAYPSIDKLLGSEFFDAMALIYVQQSPLSQSNLHAAGADFPEFIHQFPHVAAYPYLSDVARLDWAIHHAHYAPDKTSYTAQQLAEQATQLASLRFELHPALTLLQSPYPIVSILEMQQGGAAPDDLNQPEYAAIWRDQYLRISAADYCFLAVLQNGDKLMSAIDQVAQYDAEFNPAFALNLILEQGLLISIG